MSEGNGFASASARATYVRSANYGRILTWDRPDVRCFTPFTCAYMYHEIERGTGNDAAPARANIGFSLTWGGTATQTMSLFVSGASAWSSSSL